MAIDSKMEMRPNPNVMKILRGIAAQDMRKFGQMALSSSRDETPVDTGTLKRSEEFSMESDTIGVLKTRTGYGAYVHFGTSRQQANPFFARGTDAAIQPFASMLAARSDYKK